MDVFDVRENAERGDDNNDDCNRFGWSIDDDESFAFIGSLLIVDDGDKIKFEFVCFVWSIRILFVIFAAPFERIDGEFKSCLHTDEVVSNGVNGCESAEDDNSSVLIRKPDVVVLASESDDSKIKNK